MPLDARQIGLNTAAGSSSKLGGIEPNIKWKTGTSFGDTDVSVSGRVSSSCRQCFLSALTEVILILTEQISLMPKMNESSEWMLL
jgi:hypothetical protein